MSDVITKVIIANEIKNGGIVVNAPFGADQSVSYTHLRAHETLRYLV